MKIKAAPRIVLVAGACALALVGLVVREGAARSGGLEMMLPMEAVDPRNLLSGHYVDINLTQRLAPEASCPQGAAESKWLALQPMDDVYTLAGAASSRDEAQQVAAVPVRGSFECWEGPGVEGAPAQTFVRLHLGVDRFHINQADALRIERVLREQQPGETRARAIISVGRDGRARLKGLMIDGERLDLDWL